MFENRLKEIRARRRMTQLRLSIETQIPQTKLSYYENGFQTPNLKDKIKIADVLEVDVKEIWENATTR